MNGTEEIIVDSSMSFSEAVEGTTAPEEIILTMSLMDVLYYSFDGRKHQGQIIVNRELEDDVYDIFNFIEKIFFPIEKLFPFPLISGMIEVPWRIIIPLLSTSE